MLSLLSLGLSDQLLDPKDNTHRLVRWAIRALHIRKCETTQSPTYPHSSGIAFPLAQTLGTYPYMSPRRSKLPIRASDCSGRQLYHAVLSRLAHVHERLLAINRTVIINSLVSLALNIQATNRECIPLSFFDAQWFLLRTLLHGRPY